MVSVRPATHAGSWYSNDPSRLLSQLDKYFKLGTSAGMNDSADVFNPIEGARVLIGPHAGYTYSGARLAETFKVWDTSKVKRVFMLGPSHHVYFKTSALVSKYDLYETPFGNVPIDTQVIKDLIMMINRNGKLIFKYMSEDIDDDEHSFEMHTPFIHYATRLLPQGIPKIIPIMISGLDDSLNNDIVQALLPFLDNEENTFIISSDFCHWGSRFGYTEYVPFKLQGDLSKSDVITLHLSTMLKSSYNPIYESIQILDREAMKIATSGSYAKWKEYIGFTGNTICGQKPISIVLKLIEEYEAVNGKSLLRDDDIVFKWIGYSQSSNATSYHDSSVSYASGYVKLI